MGFSHTLDELQQKLDEIRKQHRLKRFRRLLRFLLIGFLIGRDSDKKIRAGISFRSDILEALDHYAEDNTNSDRSRAVNEILERVLKNYELASKTM
jgi:hypothetical protein